MITPGKHGAAHSYECVLSIAGQGADLQSKSVVGNSAVMQPNRLRSGGFASKSGLCRANEVCKSELWATPLFPKPSPKRDRAVTKAETVSPLNPRCRSVLRPSRVFAGIFGYFCFPDKSDSPISLQSKRGEMVFSGFCAAKPCF